MNKSICVFVSLSLLFSTCKKSNITPPPEINKQNISGTYHLTARKLSATGIPEQDAYPSLQDCVKDDLYVLNSDNSFEYVDAETVCDPTTGFTGTWNLDGNTISFYGETGTITKFDGRIMEITVTTTVQDTTFITRSTYKKH